MNLINYLKSLKNNEIYQIEENDNLKYEFLSHIKFYENFNYLTNIDIKLISEITLIHPKVLEEFFKIIDHSNL